jgi:nicotinamide-nucleotide amidase
MKRQLSGIELVAIGNELLSGHTLDTNAAQIARNLETIGLRVVRKATVGDDPSAIADAVRESLTRTGAVITTGGLGPTRDDATKAAVAGVFGKKLEFREDLWAELEERWAGRSRIPSSNRSQAEVPEGGKVLRNPRGTAPGLVVEDEGHGLCILLPGPPGEVKAILEESVVPLLTV